MTDIIKNWIFGPSDFDKPDPVKEVKRRKKKVTKIVEEGESKTQDNSLTISSSKSSEGVTKNKFLEKIEKHKKRNNK